jgi:hypothetical protein
VGLQFLLVQGCLDSKGQLLKLSGLSMFVMKHSEKGCMSLNKHKLPNLQKKLTFIYFYFYQEFAQLDQGIILEEEMYPPSLKKALKNK